MSTVFQAKTTLAGRDDFGLPEPGEPSDYDAGNGMVIPGRMIAAVERYTQRGMPPGKFWQAIIKNDLQDACARADSDNQRIIPAYLIYLYNEAPGPCWGSPEKFEAWVARWAAKGGAT